MGFVAKSGAFFPFCVLAFQDAVYIDEAKAFVEWSHRSE
jgi:hypothetical protein